MADVVELVLEVVEGKELDVLSGFFGLEITVVALVISISLVVNISFILVSSDECGLKLSTYLIFGWIDDCA